MFEIIDFIILFFNNKDIIYFITKSTRVNCNSSFQLKTFPKTSQDNKQMSSDQEKNYEKNDFFAFFLFIFCDNKNKKWNNS